MNFQRDSIKLVLFTNHGHCRFFVILNIFFFEIMYYLGLLYVEGCRNFCLSLDVSTDRIGKIMHHCHNYSYSLIKLEFEFLN